MLLGKPGQLVRPKVFGAAGQCRPQPTVHERDLAGYQPADKDLAGSADGTGNGENFLAARMRPPVAMHGFAGDSLNQGRHLAMRSLQHDAMLTDEGEGLLGSQ